MRVGLLTESRSLGIAPLTTALGSRLWVISRLTATTFPTSAFEGKADLNHSAAEGPLIARSGSSVSQANMRLSAAKTLQKTSNSDYGDIRLPAYP